MKDNDQEKLWETYLNEANHDAGSEETGRIPPGKGLDRPTEPMSDEEGNSRKLEVGDFEKELVDLYWAVVDAGIDENLAGNWFDGVRENLHELLRRHNENDIDLQDLGSKF